MARIHDYYVLCPLLDQKSFLGVSEDKDTECVIVTLGRNVVNKYRLSDQKQIGGWTSKDHITSTVIFDQVQNCYIGVFNNNCIKLWEDCENYENLDKAKKYKFPLNIFKVIGRRHQPPLVIFSNGNCASLPYAIENCKTYDAKSIIKENEVITDIISYSVSKTDHICYITKNNNDLYEIITCPLRDELGDLEKSKIKKVKVTRCDDTYVVGHLACVNEKNAVYIIWNDSKISMYDLEKKSWKIIGTIPWISTLSSVSLAWMGKNHLILFGSNIDQDGAIIVAYNVILGIGSCKYPMKMYTENARLYCYKQRIILEASNHIGMLPYVLEIKRNLSSLLGSHDITQDEIMEIADWHTSLKPSFKVREEIKDLLKLGLPERSICSQVITPLLDKDDYLYIFQVLKEFNDIPELVIVLLMNYVIKTIKLDHVDITNQAKFLNFCLGNGLTKKEAISHKAKLDMLNYLFGIPFCDALLIPYLKNSTTLDSALFLMSYITFLLTESDISLDADYESKLYDWCTILMDSFYQQYLMTKSEKVTCVLDNTLKVVNNLINQLYSIDNIMPLLNKMLYGKQYDHCTETLSYSIDILEI